MTERGLALTQAGIGIDGRLIPFLSGSCHYWRLERERWPLILERFAGLGLPILQTYVPWSVHEQTRGEFDFGERTPNNDLPRFLELCRRRGLYVFLRPGPHINAELTYFGYPKRLFADPRNLALTGHGTPAWLPAPPRAFPAISYVSEHFFSELELWFDAFAKAAAPYAYPDGPVIGIQPDNEMSFFFRTAAYDLDYAPGARECYRQWLAEKYGTPDRLAAAYGRPCTDFAEVPMPRAFAAREQKDLPYYLDWAEFRETLLYRPLGRIMDMLKVRGFSGLIAFHNYPLNAGQTPFHTAAAERVVDANGVDFYSRKTDHRLMKPRLLALTGSSRFPFSPEFSSGCYQVWPPIDLEDQRFTTLLALAYGLRGVNFYMAVERERWVGAPISRHGEERPGRAAFYKRLTAFLRETGVLGMDPVADAAILRVRDYDRLEKAADLFSPLLPMVTDSFLNGAARAHEGRFGFARPIQIAHQRLLDAWRAGLERAQVSFVFADTETDPALLARRRVAFMPGFEFLGAETQQRLADYIAAGGTLVIGPTLPDLDAGMRPCTILKERLGAPQPVDGLPGAVGHTLGQGRALVIADLCDLAADGWDALVRQVCAATKLAPLFPADDGCETSTRLGDDGRRLVFLVNPTPEARRPTVRTGGGVAFVDRWTGERFAGGEAVAVPIEPYTVRPLEATPC
ncbi:MAG: hypothetical protein C4523_00870 [Myxococcales bacterium]|nr:MAG: hypothetical protein C4523_00870 [Myxococcales bacterium]